MDHWPDQPSLSVYFVVRRLVLGGGVVQAELLARALHQRGHAPTFVVLYEGGALESSIRDEFPVVCIGKRGRWDLLRCYVRLVRVLRVGRPDVIYGWLPIANLLSLAAKPFVRWAKVVVSVHGGGRDLATLPWPERANHVLHLRLARWADGVIVNSAVGVQELLSAGVKRAKISLVPNGVDVDLFCPDAAGGDAVRDEWGIGTTDVVFGLVATRFEQVKGHDVFLRAAAVVARRLPDALFVCLGEGTSDRIGELRALADEIDVSHRVRWVGLRQDMKAVYSAFDVVVCSSRSEGGPNVVAEAMACGTPCAVTDVGHAAEMVGETGVVVPVEDWASLAQGMVSLAKRVGREGDLLAKAVRARITERFGSDCLVTLVLEAIT